jgi:hypothetical protein
MTVRNRVVALLLAFAIVLSIAGPGLSGPAIAQQPPPVHRKKNFIQRHPTLTGVAAGVTAYKVAKKTGQNRKMHGKKLNFAQRHPVLTGVAAGAAARHYAKKSAKKVDQENRRK